MLGKGAPCSCGCERVLKGQSRGFAKHAVIVRHLVDGLRMVVRPSVPDDSSQRPRLEQMESDGRSIEADLLSVAHGERSAPGYSIADIDSWMEAATKLIGSQARAIAAQGHNPADVTGWAP
jgi:hypothetical protein